MYCRNIFNLSFFCIILSSFAYSNDPEVLTILTKIVNADIEVEKSRLSLEQAKEVLKQKETAYLPDLKFNQNFGKKWGDYPINSTDDELKRSSNFTLTQNLFRGFVDKKQIEIAQEEIEQKKQELALTKQNTLKTVLQEIFAVASIRSDYLNLKEEYKVDKYRLKTVEEDIKKGTARPAEKFNILTSLSSIKIDLEEKSQELKNLKFQFEKRYRVLVEEHYLEVDELSALVLVLKKNMNEKTTIPEIQLKEKALSIANKNIELQKSLNFPSLDFGITYKFLDSDEILKKTKWSTQLTISMPFPFGMAARSKSNEAVLARQEKELDLNLTKENNSIDISDKESQLEQSRKSLELLSELVKISKQNMQQQENDKKHGFSRISDVLQASTAYQEALQKYNRKKIGVLNSEITMILTKNIINLDLDILKETL